jgi:hypothetical protein
MAKAAASIATAFQILLLIRFIFENLCAEARHLGSPRPSEPNL